MGNQPNIPIIENLQVYSQILAEFNNMQNADYSKENIRISTEPFTAAWLGIKLAEGVVAWVGGKLFADLVGANKNIDIAALIEEVIRAISKIIRQEILENELRQLNGQLQQLQTDFVHYMNAPQGIDRLANATQLASNVVAQLATFGLMGQAGYLIGLSLHVAIIQERIKVYGDAERKNLKEILNRGVAWVAILENEWKKLHRARYSISVPFEMPKVFTCYALKDGVKIGGVYGEPKAIDAVALANKFLEAQIPNDWPFDTQYDHAKPALDISSKWTTLLASL